MQSIDNKVISRIYGKGRGWCFTPNEFLDLGSRDSVDKALSRLTQKGTIRRLVRGLYDYPKMHKDLGSLTASPESIARALAGRGAQRIQPTGAYAANLLGLSTQVPAKIIFLTDGPDKTIQVGNQRIQLKHTTTGRMATAGRVSGLVYEAFRYIGKDQISSRVIDQLRKRLDSKAKRTLIDGIANTPAWMGKYIREIARRTE